MANDSLPSPIMSRKEAKALGLNTFFTGLPCKRGHIGPRVTVNNDCATCRAARVQTWNETNKDRRYAIRQKWRAGNKDKERASQRAWSERNRDFVKTYSAAYYRANKDKHRALTQRWKSEHPIEQVIYSQNTRARRLDITGRGLAISDYHNMIVDQGGCCAYCGEAHPLVFDHVLAFGRGGTHEPKNVVLSCRRCNTAKSVDRLVTFLEFLVTKRRGLWTATPNDVDHLLSAPWRSLS